MIILVIILCVTVFAVLMQKIELQRFRVVSYSVNNEKIAARKKLAVFSDLHCHVFFPQNNRLINAVRRIEPDAILMSGDMITARDVERFDRVLGLMRELIKIAPVYYSMGNHEDRIKKMFLFRDDDEPDEIYERRVKKMELLHSFYEDYENALRKMGVRILDNEYDEIGDDIRVYGLSIPLECYKKRDDIPLPDGFIESVFGTPDEKRFNIMLAHEPRFAKRYAAWGAELTFSGHNHGGLVRIPGVGSVFGPRLERFPEYDMGEYDVDGKKLIVSAGLGVHSFKIRIFNRAQLLEVTLDGK